MGLICISFKKCGLNYIVFFFLLQNIKKRNSSKTVPPPTPADIRKEMKSQGHSRATGQDRFDEIFLWDYGGQVRKR